MSVEGRELGWDDSIKQDSQNFDPIPEGDYNVTIEKYDRSRSKGEGKLPPCNMAVVYFIVHGPDREIKVELDADMDLNITIDYGEDDSG